GGSDVQWLASDGAVHVSAGGQELRFPITAPGAHMAMNAAAALAGCLALGLDPQRAAEALQGFAPVAGRGLQRELGGILLLDESYNASSASVRAALGVLRGMPGRREA